MENKKMDCWDFVFSFVKNLIRRLMSCYGVSLKPIINEFK